MLALFFFGPRVEERLGARRFLTLYFLSGISGAALSFVFSPTAAIIGASGAVFGVELAFARFWPRVPIYIWGVLPIEARWMIVGMTVLTLYGASSGGGGIAHFAHLGGFLGAFIYLRFLECEQRRPPIPRGGQAQAAGLRPPPRRGHGALVPYPA